MLIVTDPIAKVHHAGAEAWQPRLRPLRSEWCERHMRLPSEFSAQPGLYSFRGRPFFREILDTIDDPAYAEMALCMATQIGKTTLLQAAICSQGEVDRAPMLFAGPDQPYAREQRSVIYKICESSPVLKERIPPERLRNDRWIDLQHCYVYLGWSGSTQRLSGRSCKVVLCSEVDRWQQSTSLAAERTKAFWRGMVVYESSPIKASPTIWPLYKNSDRRTWRVPCPHCGHYQELRFFPHKSGPYAGNGGVGGLKDERGNWLAPHEARKAAYYICEKGCRIDPRHKAEMVERGVWVPEGCEVTPDGTVVGTPKNLGRRAGFHLSSLYAPTRTVGDVAEQYLLLRDTTEGMERFFNDWLALPYEPRGQTPKWKDLGIRLAGTHPRGTVPAHAYFLTAAADVQARGVYWSVRAWGDGKTSWLVDWGFVPKIAETAGSDEDAPLEEQLASDLVQLDQVILGRRWPVLGENPRGLSQLAVCKLGIDCGYRPTEVYAFVRSHAGERVIAVRGDPKIVPGTLYRLSTVDRNVRTGHKYPEGVQAWNIETGAYKSEICDRWVADRKQPGVWWLPANILEVDGGEDYLRQITAETRSLELVNGRKTIRWALISHDMPNHYWDTEVYQACLADMIVGHIWDASQWGEPRRSPSPAEEAAELAARDSVPEDFSAR
jgi:phage terminase large subunit GpA-like protein